MSDHLGKQPYIPYKAYPDINHLSRNQLQGGKQKAFHDIFEHAEQKAFHNIFEHAKNSIGCIVLLLYRRHGKLSNSEIYLSYTSSPTPSFGFFSRNSFCASSD